MENFYLIGGMALVTFSLRYLLLPLSGRIRLSTGVQRALSYVPPVVLTAIIVPAALMPDGSTLHLSWTNPYLAGATVTALVGFMARNLLVTIISGMIAFLAWQWVLGRGWL